MTKLVTFLSALVLSSTAMAKNMECGLNINLAGSGGLVPAEKIITLKSAPLQMGHLELTKCSSTVIANLKVSLCGIESREALGIYTAEILIEEVGASKDEGVNFTSASTLLATSKHGKGIVELDNKLALSPIFAKKMNAADLSFPDYQGGDSLAIDDAVSAAYRKGIINGSDIVTIALDSCQLK